MLIKYYMLYSNSNLEIVWKEVIIYFYERYIRIVVF